MPSSPVQLGRDARDLPPDAAGLTSQFGGGSIRVKDIHALHRWLSQVIPGAAFAESVTTLETGARWLRSGAVLSGSEPAPIVRLRLLVDVLERVPAWRGPLQQAIATVLGTATALHLFETGLPNDRGLGDETFDRMARHFLPTPDDPHDLGELLARLFPERSDAEWLSNLPEELLSRLKRLIAPPDASSPFEGTQTSLGEAMVLISTRASALGLTSEMRERSPKGPLSASPFYLLPRICDEVLSRSATPAAFREQIAACRGVLEAVLAHLEEFGVSVDVVYRIEVIGKNLDRLADLLGVLESAGEERPRATVALLARLVEARIRDISLRDLVRTNLRLLARKIIERAGQTGEHYITSTRAEYWRMVASATGGGVLTAGTTVCKYLVNWGHFPLFVLGSLTAANYAGSFIVMQLLGFTLATKQTSMTAAALAGALRGGSADFKPDQLVTLIARICRSQLAAVVSNMAAVIPATIGFHYLYAHAIGHPFLDEKTAEHTLESLHPTHTGTLYFAALTGLFLWLASVGAGWLENWAVYRRIPEGIAQHRLGRWVGRRTMRWLSREFSRHVAGIGGNVTLGFLLGMVPVLGTFFGVPLEVRHITLSTASMTLAICTLGSGAPALPSAAIGLFSIGLLNFGVGFSLALGVAMRARGVEHAGLRLLRAVLARIASDPLEFVYPPAGAEPSPPNH